MLRSTIFTETLWFGLGMQASNYFLKIICNEYGETDPLVCLTKENLENLIEWTKKPSSESGINPESMKEKYREVLDKMEPGSYILITSLWFGHSEKEKKINEIISGFLLNLKNKKDVNILLELDKLKELLP